ncbi:MAG: hypothetical protein U0232_30055 [Thermomicrobiales bacterium]
MPPSIVLGCLLGSIYGLLGHAFVGQHWRQLPVYWLGGVAGFFAGYVVAALSGGGMLALGSVPLLESSLGSGLVLALFWLSIGRRPRRAQLAAGDLADD